jgi:hypothetical protein
MDQVVKYIMFVITVLVHLHVTFTFFYIHPCNFYIPVFVHKLLISIVSARDVFLAKLVVVFLLTGCILFTSGKAAKEVLL